MPATSSTTDRIEKKITLKAPRARVWRAIADSAEFGAWFQMRFEDVFTPGRTVRAQVLVPGYEHVQAEFQIVTVRPEDYLMAERRASELGVDVLGFYHSHPDHPARPSRYDLDHAWPFMSYVIVSVRAGVPDAMTSWRLREDRSAFDPERLTYAEHH